MRKLGVDCGNTIFDEWNGMLLPGSIDTLAKIVESGMFEEVYVVSKANTLARIFFRVRLRSLDFWNRTGIPRENLYFCKRFKDKAEICETLDITHFVDDRLRVLHYLEIPARYAMNPTRRRDFRKYPETAEEVTIVKSWEELSKLLLPANIA